MHKRNRLELANYFLVSSSTAASWFRFGFQCKSQSVQVVHKPALHCVLRLVSLLHPNVHHHNHHHTHTHHHHHTPAHFRSPYQAQREMIHYISLDLTIIASHQIHQISSKSTVVIELILYLVTDSGRSIQSGLQRMSLIRNVITSLQFSLSCFQIAITNQLLLWSNYHFFNRK